MTSAYKEKLIEMKRWKEEDQRLQNLENETTVEGKKDMTGFYANLMTKVWGCVVRACELAHDPWCSQPN